MLSSMLFFNDQLFWAKGLDEILVLKYSGCALTVFFSRGVAFYLIL